VSREGSRHVHVDVCIASCMERSRTNVELRFAWTDNAIKAMPSNG